MVREARVAEYMAHSEKRYCPVCKERAIFISKHTPSGYFCSECGYRVEEGERNEGGKGDKRSTKEAKGRASEKGAIAR